MAAALQKMGAHSFTTSSSSSSFRSTAAAPAASTAETRKVVKELGICWRGAAQ